jgi:O-antigen/teichoic acid export membrane protein
MSRRRNALLAASFTAGRSLLALLTSFYVTRLLVHTLGVDVYGLWLASGGLLAYAALADLGIFSVMSWLFAEADGKRDLDLTRSLISNGLLAGLVAGVAYAAAALALWELLPRLIPLGERELGLLRGPFRLMIGVAALCYPLRLFAALRSGLQDFGFLGSFQLGETLLGAALTYGLLRGGYGLYAIAIASVIPSSLVNAAALLRTLLVNPKLLQTLPRPNARGVRPILASGAGGWLGTLGWQLAFATDSIVIAHLGQRHLIPSFMITSRLGLTLMQFLWSLPDSASIGLAHLGAEGDRRRTSDVVQTLIRIHLFGAGAIACALLAGNAGFVTTWVGAELFGGSGLNAILALDVVVLSVTHALVVPPAVLGSRLQIGAITLLNGVVHILLAWCLGARYGLNGIAAATALSALVTSIPVGLALLARRTELTVRRTSQLLVLPWVLRFLPCAAAAALLGWASGESRWAAAGRFGPLLLGSCAAAAAVGIYLYVLRGQLRELPLGVRLTRLLSAVRLVSSA